MNRRRNLLRAMCAAAGGGGKKPALINSILQWLTKYVGGSIPFDDKVDPRLDSPELVGVNHYRSTVTNGQCIDTVAVWNPEDKDFGFDFWYDSDHLAPATIPFALFDSATGVREFVLEVVLRGDDGRIYMETGPSSGSGAWTVDTVDVADRPALNSGWHFVTIRKSGTSVAWTIDGLPVSSSGGAEGTLQTSTRPLGIGGRWDWYPAIQATKILGISGAVAYLDGEVFFNYKLGEGDSCEVVFDSSGNNRHGRLYGTSLTSWGVTALDDPTLPCTNFEDGFTDATTLNGYDLWLITEDARGLSGGGHATVQGYHTVANTDVSPFAPSVHRSNLIARSYSLTDGGAL